MTDETPDPRRWWTLGVLCLSLLVISLDNTILNVALPTLELDLGASSSQLQWIVDSYMLVFAGLLLTAGALGDRFGRRRALTFGLTVFGLGSALSAFAGSAEALIASRALMGVGGAFIMPSTLSILTATFPARERAKAIGIWAGVSGLGIAIGPVAGGWIIEHADWSWIFLVNVPFVAAALLAGRWLVPESLDPSAPRLDFPGFALSTSGLVALVWAIIEAPNAGWTSPKILAGLGVAAAVLLAFVAWERRTPHPMLDVKLFSNRRFSAASGAITLSFFAMFGAIYFLTQYLQLVLGFSALEAGVRILPVAAGLVIGGPLSARLSGKIGAKVVVASGLAMVASALFLMTQFQVGSGYELVAAAFVLLGIGIGMAMTPATDAVMGSLPLAKASVGSAVNDAARTTGGAFGVAIMGSIMASSYRGDMDAIGAGAAAQDSLSGALATAVGVGGQAGARLAATAQEAFVSGMHTAVLVGAAIALIGALVALLFLPAREGATATMPALVPEPVPA
jgi:EmrB/QacA subfamily drug resistance transporter